jgi:hypothetical protein
MPMSLPAAVSPDPIAVLVLAWDEATPAVRALVEATQAAAPALDSLLVMVPQANAPEGMSAAEHLPPPAPPAELLAPATAPLPTVTAPLPAGPDALAPTPALALRSAAASASSLAAPASPAPEQPAATTAPPLAWSAVRVVRLGSLSLPNLAARAGQPLPAPIWTGAIVAPAAPYVGATTAAEESSAALLPLGDAHVASPGLAVSEAAAASGIDLPQAPARASQPPALRPHSPAQAAPLYDTTASIAQAPDLEADLAVAEADELASLEAAEATGLPLADYSSSAAPTTPAQADWEAALATLRQPAAQPETVVAAPIALRTEVVSTVYPALRPAAQHYPAPDLNFQIIQYARFAVPVALAEAPFEVLYAPAWPTWLAAQELRQRTGRPLVLHVAALAAADDESIETATGWIAELQRQALRRADLLIAETPALAQRLRRELELDASRVLAIPAAEALAIAQALRGAQVSPVAA